MKEVSFKFDKTKEEEDLVNVLRGIETFLKFCDPFDKFEESGFEGKHLRIPIGHHQHQRFSLYGVEQHNDSARK